MATVILKGSERAPLANARAIAPADPNERLEVTVLVRRQARTEFSTRVAALATEHGENAIMSREQFAAQHGAGAADLAAVRAFASAHGLTVVQEDAARRTVILAGTVAQFSAAFAVQLQQYQHPEGSYRGRVGAVQLPAELDGIIEAVLGLDNRPQAEPHFRLRAPAALGQLRAGRVRAAAAGRSKGKAAKKAGASKRHRQASPVSYAPTQLASLYGFPSGTGKGQCVAIIELGGGFRPADLASYFAGLNVPAPKVVAISVDHGRNAPTGDANGPDGEVMLDIEVVGAVAPAASIVVYFAPNTDAGFLDAVTTAIHDTTNNPSVISISWGGPESSWTAQSMKAMDEAFQAAATLGITICVASGDSGSSDGVNDGSDHVDFPASSPFALACGGTSLRARQQAISSEVVWNDGANGGASGGGISSFFPAPSWQAGIAAKRSSGESLALTMRGVPDVSGDADPETGYKVLIDGEASVIGGTSAVAPLWAGLIARINQATTSPSGYLNPQLYKNPKALRDITQGNNGDFAATTGWDACAGLGSPVGSALASLLKRRAKQLPSRLLKNSTNAAQYEQLG